MTPQRSVPATPAAPRPSSHEDAEGQGMAFRAFGEQIHEIGLRQISEGVLTTDDVAAVAFCARNLLIWCEQEAAAGGLDLRRAFMVLTRLQDDEVDEFAARLLQADARTLTPWLAAQEQPK